MKFSVEELRAKAAKFQRRVQRRNLREYMAALIVIGWAGVACWKVSEPLPRIAFAMLIAAAIFYISYLRRAGLREAGPRRFGRRCLRHLLSK